MKLAAGIGGAIISGALCFLLFALMSKYQLATVGYTPAQSGRLADAFMFAAPLFMLFGGLLGLWVSKKYLTRRSKPTPKNGVA